MQMVVIMSRPQCVKHDIALDRYHYSHISNKYVWVIMWTKKKATFAVTHIIITIIKPVAYTETTCIPDTSIALPRLLKTTLQHEHVISYEMTTKYCSLF